MKMNKNNKKKKNKKKNKKKKKANNNNSSSRKAKVRGTRRRQPLTAKRRPLWAAQPTTSR